MTTVWLVGEHNPYGGDKRFALYPKPSTSAGGRLCAMLGMAGREYLRTFTRRNLLSTQKWSALDARNAAWALTAEAAGAPLVLLGSKVAKAFSVDFRPYTKVPGDRPWWIIPHPSGMNRLWNAPGARDAARRTIHEAIASLPAPLPAL